MNKHTPGPWRVIPRDGKFPNAVQRGRQGGFEVRGLDNETEDADARLIASAPDLLEALQIAVRQNSHDMQMTGEELRACTAAIAKATGD